MDTENRNQFQAELFFNRISKNIRQLKKWARKNRITCWRLYDKDIPEIPLAADLYTFIPSGAETKEDCAKHLATLNEEISLNSPEAQKMLDEERRNTYIHLYLYERPYDKPEEEEREWLSLMKKQAARAAQIPEENVITKMRRHQTDGEKRSQYEKIGSEKSLTGTVQECGQLFEVNLTDYIDTGLFFDHRPLRNTVREEAKGKDVLNLFCYTGSFSVYSAEGRASSVTSVDLSKTYLEWAKRNMSLNGFEGNQYEFINSDTEAFLDEAKSEGKKYGIIILDPPTFSNSKKTKGTLDINRDWSNLVKKCTLLLAPKGILYFSTNSRKLSFDESLIPEGFAAKEISGQTVPEDYRNKKIHRAWKITRDESKESY